jgi:hypothetical protein
MQMNKPIKNFIYSFHSVLLLLLLTLNSSAYAAMTIGGPITANNVTVNGSVTFSSMTVSSITVTNLLNVTGATVGLPGSIVQMSFSSGTDSTITT